MKVYFYCEIILKCARQLAFILLNLFLQSSTNLLFKLLSLIEHLFINHCKWQYSSVLMSNTILKILDWFLYFMQLVHLRFPTFSFTVLSYLVYAINYFAWFYVNNFFYRLSEVYLPFFSYLIMQHLGSMISWTLCKKWVVLLKKQKAIHFFQTSFWPLFCSGT